MKLKRLWGRIHLWIGLAVGIPFFLIALSGAIYSWEPEISTLIYQQKVTAQNQPFTSVSALRATMQREFPKGDFRTAFFKDQTHTAEVLLYAPGTYYIAFLNPYTAELVHLQDMKRGWLNYLKLLHRELLLGPKGKQVIHWVTLLSLLMIISGIVLWWPVNKIGRRKRFRIKWGVSPRRLNYDIHNVLGFYASWVVLFIILTGIFWGFESVRNGLKSITGETKIQYDIAESIPPASEVEVDPFPLLDSLAFSYKQAFSDKFIRVSNPHGEKEPIRVTVLDPSLLLYRTNHYYHDRYTGQQLEGHFEYDLRQKTSSYHQLNNYVYDIHFGTILGFPGRLLACLASLIFASLPITGFFIWWSKGR